METTITTTSSVHKDTERISHMFKALGHPVRLEIMRFVRQNPRCIGNDILLHLPEACSRAQSTLSQHLKILSSVGLLKVEHDGTATCYSINQKTLLWLRFQLAQL
jgi:DNA-binding transcriptional ArsR family regulator